MTHDTTPVLAGVGRVTQRVESPGGGMDAVDLMSAVSTMALADSGAKGLASRVGLIAVPRGTWRCTDPGRIIGGRIGATSARTVVAEVGVLQQTLITRACASIAAGEIDAAIVCGGETKYRSIVASREGTDAPEAAGPSQPPDEVLRPHSPVVSAFEFERGIVMPAVQYAMIESAYAHAHGWTKEAHRGRLGALWAGYAQVAAADPLAWDRSAPDANTIVEASDDNRMVAFPYTRLLCSQWNVDQAAALVFASAGAARELGVASDRFVFPLAAAESNAMIPMPERREIHRWPAFALAASRALDLAGVSLDDIRLMEIYSCFPSAVQAQLGELGLSDERPLTVTGGMTFAGGPLNNFVLQSTAAMAERIRESGDTGLVTGVSGLLTKPAAALWSSAPPREGFRSADVSEESLHATQIHPMSVDERGHATIVGSTVSYERGRPPRALAVLQLDDGSRTVAGSDDPDDVEALTSTDPVGLRAVALEPGRFTAQTS